MLILSVWGGGGGGVGMLRVYSYIGWPLVQLSVHEYLLCGRAVVGLGVVVGDGVCGEWGLLGPERHLCCCISF
jgi:hypothetical protein